MHVEVRAVDVAHAHRPRRQVLDVADLDPAFLAEYLHAPRFGGGDEGAEIPGGAIPEAKQHGGGVVDAVIEHAAIALRVHGIDLSGKVEHGIDDVHAAAGHAAGRAFLAVQAPVIGAEAVHAGAAKIAFDVQ